jgi:hypothetical protein
MFPYACSQCGGEAKVSPAGVVSRACGHDDATVIAERTSVLYGRCRVATPSLINRAVAALQRLAGID